MGTRIAAILIFVLLALLGWREFDSYTEKTALRAELKGCREIIATVPRTDTIYDTLFDVFYIPKPYPVTSIDTVHDTVTGNYSEILTTYADSVPSKDITLFYALKTSGTLKDLQLSYRLRQQQVISERIVYKDREVEVSQRFHLWGGLAFGEGASQATLAATYDRVGVMYVHDITHSRPMVGVVFKFR